MGARNSVQSRDEDPSPISLSKAAFPLEVSEDEGATAEWRRRGRRVRFVCVSDVHRRPGAVPDGDVLLFAGDYAMHWLWSGSEERAARELNAWLGTLPHRHKIVVAGNHDMYLAQLRRERARALLSNCTYLEDDCAVVEGVRVYGAPWTPRRSFIYRACAFADAGPAALARRWEGAESADVLLTHCPPWGVLDVNHLGIRMGSLSLRNACLCRTQPRVHVFGHNHQQPGAVVGLFPDNPRPCLLLNVARSPTVFDYFLPPSAEPVGDPPSSL